jgi:hypothetical protein
MYYSKNHLGANTTHRTTYKEHALGVTEFANANQLIGYGQAAGSISAGPCEFDPNSGVISSGAGWYADAAFASGEYGWVRQSAEDEVVIPFYALSANGGDAATATIVAPFNFRIKRIDTVLLGGALASGNFVLTTKIAGVDVTDGVVTVTQAGSAAGDKDSATPTAANTGDQGATITLVGSGSSTGSRTINGFVTLQRV